MKIVMIKTQTGALVPMDEDEAEKLRKYKVGSIVRGEFAEMRNGAFFRKFFCLMNIAYDNWTDGLVPQEYKGEPVQPEKTVFRKNIIIQAGFYEAVYMLDGSMRLEAKSISWDKMKEPEFEQLYSACINVILAKVLSHKRHTSGITSDELRSQVEAVMRFS